MTEGNGVDQAVAKAALEPRWVGHFTIGSGRRVEYSLPLPLSAEEVIELMTAIPAMVANANGEFAARTGGLVLPGGGVRVVPKAGES